MAVNGFKYAGVRLDNVSILERNQPYWAPKSNELITVPGRPGAVFTRQQTEVLTISLTVLVDKVPGVPFSLTAEEFATWLNGYDEPQALVFDSDPNRTYFAILDGDVDVEQVVRYAKVGITFICPDPYKYGNEKTATIDAGSIVTVGGTAETKPVIEVTMRGSSTYVAVGNGEEINMVGRSASVEEEPVERLERIFWTEADTISGWVPPATSEEGTIAGTMYSDGYRFMASDYGTGTMYHGPALKRGIPRTLTNFQVDALVELYNLPEFNKRGKIVVSGLDANNRVVFMMSMGDGYNTPKNLGHIRAGDKATGTNIIAHAGEPPAWNDFYGRLRVGRNNGLWYAYIARVDPGKGYQDSVRMYREFRGSGAQYTRTLSQIQVHIMAHSTAPVARPRLEDLKVYEIHQTTPTQVPIIARAGDVIRFDHQRGEITEGADDLTPDKAFIGEYFSLRPGRQTIVAEPASAIQSVRVRWRDKWH